MSSALESKDFPPCFYRVTVKGLIVKDGKILLVKEALPPKASGQWELPGGGLDFGEDIYDCLKREVQEEMGVKVKSIEKRPTYVWPWRLEDKRGMDWFYVLVVGYKIELESFDFKASEECEDIGFFSKEELGNLELYPHVNGLKNVFDAKDFE